MFMAVLTLHCNGTEGKQVWWTLWFFTSNSNMCFGTNWNAFAASINYEVTQNVFIELLIIYFFTHNLIYFTTAYV